MTAVVEVGPAHVAGPGAVDPELVRIALACIDDRLAVHDDRITPVRELWCAVAAAVLAERCGRVTLVVPEGWPAARVALVESALLTRCSDVVVRRPGEGPSPPVDRPVGRVRVVAVAVGAVLVAAGLAGAALRPAAPVEQPATSWVVEGLVAVEVPADWAVQRVVVGPGSARVQAVSPDGGAAVHLTQAVVSAQETRDGTARALDAALNRQPPGVFVDFDPQATVAERPAVTYRELRARPVDWTVVVDDGVRIAIGCTAPRSDPVCDRAVRSARTLRGNERRTDGTE